MLNQLADTSYSSIKCQFAEHMHMPRSDDARKIRITTFRKNPIVALAAAEVVAAEGVLSNQSVCCTVSMTA